MSGGGGSSNTTSTTVQKADPWAGQQPYLTDIFSEAQRLYQNEQPQYYPGNTIANFDPLETLGQQLTLQNAASPMQNIADNTAGAQNFLLRDAMDLDTNPHARQAIDAAINPIYDRLERQTLPGIASGAVAGGQFGGSRQALNEASVINDANRAAFDAAGTLATDLYGQNLEATQKAIALAPQSAQLQIMPSQTIAGLGTQQRSMEQAMIEEAIARHSFDQSIPWDTLAAYQGLVQGSFGGTGSSVASRDGGGGSTGSNLLGAAGTGLSTYGMMTGMGGAMATAAPWAAAGMALLSLF